MTSFHSHPDETAAITAIISTLGQRSDLALHFLVGGHRQAWLDLKLVADDLAALCTRAWSLGVLPKYWHANMGPAYARLTSLALAAVVDSPALEAVFLQAPQLKSLNIGGHSDPGMGGAPWPWPVPAVRLEELILADLVPAELLSRLLLASCDTLRVLELSILLGGADHVLDTLAPSPPSRLHTLHLTFLSPAASSSGVKDEAISLLSYFPHISLLELHCEDHRQWVFDAVISAVAADFPKELRIGGVDSSNLRTLMLRLSAFPSTRRLRRLFVTQGRQWVPVDMRDAWPASVAQLAVSCSRRRIQLRVISR